MRSLIVQGAGIVINRATKGNLNSKLLTKWILKKQKEKCRGKNWYVPLQLSFYELLEPSLSAVDHTTRK